MTKPKNMSQTDWRKKCNARHTVRREHVGALMKKRRLQNPAPTMYAEAKRRAKKTGLAFDIELSDVQVPLACPLLGIWLTPGTVKYSASSPSLDRIDNELGYVKGNVWVISDLANRMKRDATIDQLRVFAASILRLFTT